MSQTQVKAFGNNKTPTKTILHTAIASWNGFIYQGMCALYVALDILYHGDDSHKEWMLGLESYEDFAILDNTGQIQSFHQCKCYRNSKDFTDEFEKMESKRKYWNSEGKCANDAHLYFHCNLNLNYSNGVSAYKYHNGMFLASPKDIYLLVNEMVQSIMNAQNIPGSHEAKTERLISLICTHVSSLHQLLIESPAETNSFNSVCAHPVKLQKLMDLITNTTVPLNKKEKAFCYLYYFELYLNECMTFTQHVNDGRLNSFIDVLQTMDSDNILNLIQRINPDVNVNDSNAERELEASARPNNFYQVMTDTLEEINLQKMMWQRKGVLYSPTTLGQDMGTARQCAKIVSNDNISSLLWDCNWLVGNVKESVEDVREESNKITTMSIDYSKFTKPEKLGLITIKDFNDGKY
ncbi:hypothetical protein SAMN02745213_01524 [Succinivibrio dextrinosolvens DSM 3072]|uniref:ABC-three component systems C-terminal domain-containing protein n=1 Tax=Succinivibrio dextrinosolvens DSM 3072 TaxID=1123324 RepID=A0A1T4VHC1_9GAMM|nr:ABC-three component system protein [Succinivibrio dextrinosolvens]SKA64346.1 hypothetical protein SAMN02745213_01524 [Succinivibrio dextrinosolvens DSM 3072]